MRLNPVPISENYRAMVCTHIDFKEPWKFHYSWSRSLSVPDIKRRLVVYGSHNVHFFGYLHSFMINIVDKTSWVY